MTATNEKISIWCTNFYSAISEKNYLGLEKLFPITCFIAKLTNLSESLRTDIEEEVEIKKETIYSLCQAFGFSGFEDTILPKLEEARVIKVGDKTIEVACKDQKKLLELMGAEWNKRISISQRPDKVNEIILINLMTELSKKPLNKDEIDLITKDINRDDADQIIKILENLNLIINLNSINLFCSPETFGTDCKEDIIKKLSEFRGGDQYTKAITTLQEVKDNPAIPYDNYQDKSLINELALTGFLEPYGITVQGKTIKFLFSGDLKADDLYLTKETAAHFRYANTYATKTYGKLNDPSLFLTRLIENGHSGAATNIGTDYNSLVLNRIVRVEKGGISGRYTMYPVKKDVLEGARNILNGIKPFEPRIIDTTLNDFTKNPPQTRLDPEMQKLLGTSMQEILKRLKDG